MPALILFGWILGLLDEGGVQPAWGVAFLGSVAASLWLHRKVLTWEARIPHRVIVFAAPEDDKDDFFAQCKDCGWLGGPFASKAEAKGAQATHP